MRTPVILITFNRPSFTQRVFDVIRAYQPSLLLVIADGPRSLEEARQCAAARAVIAQVDWDCQVLTNYSDVNLGCNARISSGLTWAFEQCDEAIILEDDCVPHPTFFPFCAEVLERFRYDERVMMINGSNFQCGQKRSPYSYYFSRNTNVWGWATWRRAWRYFHDGVTIWPAIRDTAWLQDVHGSKDAAAFFKMTFDDLYAGGMTWDYQWAFTCWSQNGLAIAPEINLISNIGFGSGTTHGGAITDRRANVPSAAMTFPLRHPPYMVRDWAADRFEFTQSVPVNTYHRLRRRVGAMIPASTRHAMIDVERRLRQGAIRSRKVGTGP